MHYYFHLRIGDMVERDELGLDLADVETAYLEAFKAAQEMWTELLAKRSDPLVRAFEIADANGQVLLTVPFREVLDRARRPIVPSAHSREELREECPAPPVSGAARPDWPPRMAQVDERAAYCAERARVCRERATRRGDPVYLRLEQSWFLLAESNEVVQRTSCFIEQLGRR